MNAYLLLRESAFSFNFRFSPLIYSDSDVVGHDPAKP